jgi:uncharacterized protein YcaQ
LGFVQADPIRAPARAQDLILRHRVQDYRAGDLERQYPTLEIEEDYLYAYGFLPRSMCQLTHPRKKTKLTALEKKVLETVAHDGRNHPARLEAHFGRERVVNAWGGYSKATTRALEKLHHCGLLRIAGRENGIRIYERRVTVDAKPAEERLRKLVLSVAEVLAPVSPRSLQMALTLVRRMFAHVMTTQAVVRDLLRTGDLLQEQVDGVNYLRPSGEMIADKLPPVVRFLAPFDPVVWDRQRFEHFWGWPYRFEAYTPVAKRVRGYYALPLLWGEQIIGWANATLVGGKLDVEIGYVNNQPHDARFFAELKREIEKLEAFLVARER